MLVVVGKGEDTAARPQHAASWDRRHALWVDVVKDDAVFGKPVQARALDQPIPSVALQIVRPEGIDVEQDHVPAVPPVELGRRSFPDPALGLLSTIRATLRRAGRRHARSPQLPTSPPRACALILCSLP